MAMTASKGPPRKSDRDSERKNEMSSKIRCLADLGSRGIKKPWRSTLTPSSTLRSIRQPLRPLLSVHSG